MKKILHRSETRGGGDFGWLQTKHSFSFADWFDPQRMGFGRLRVLNDDVIAPQSGFGMHPHRDMEIITIVMEGVVSHEDSLGNQKEVRAGEIQVMSAGTGVVHSESNKSLDEMLRLFQIWIEPKTTGIEPRYDQASFVAADRKNQFQTVVSSTGASGVLTIHQDARISLAEFDQNVSSTYTLENPSKGVYFFVISGAIAIDSVQLRERDGLGVREVDAVSLTAQTPSSVLVIEVPLG